MKYKNNPFNIRYNLENNWKGQIEPKNGFCQFSDIRYGFRAAYIIIYNYSRLYDKKTPKAIITRWAPETENNTESYCDFVSRVLDLDEPIKSSSDIILLMYAMYVIEQGDRPDLFHFVDNLRHSIVEPNL